MHAVQIDNWIIGIGGNLIVYVLVALLNHYWHPEEKFYSNIGILIFCSMLTIVTFIVLSDHLMDSENPPEEPTPTEQPTPEPTEIFPATPSWTLPATRTPGIPSLMPTPGVTTLLSPWYSVSIYSPTGSRLTYELLMPGLDETARAEVVSYIGAIKHESYTPRQSHRFLAIYSLDANLQVPDAACVGDTGRQGTIHYKIGDVSVVDNPAIQEQVFSAKDCFGGDQGTDEHNMMRETVTKFGNALGIMSKNTLE